MAGVVRWVGMDMWPTCFPSIGWRGVAVVGSTLFPCMSHEARFFITLCNIKAMGAATGGVPMRRSSPMRGQAFTLKWGMSPNSSG